MNSIICNLVYFRIDNKCVKGTPPTLQGCNFLYKYKKKSENRIVQFKGGSLIFVFITY